MARVTKYPGRTTLLLTLPEIWSAWEENSSYTKSPIQVAAEKGLKKIGMDPIFTYTYGLNANDMGEITYYASEDSFIRGQKVLQLEHS